MTEKEPPERDGFFPTKRISIYLYESQLRKLNEICKKRNKSKRLVFFEAIQNYIALYEKGEL